MTERDPAADKPLTMPFSNPAADLGWHRPLSRKWQAATGSAGSSERDARTGWLLFAVLVIACLAANFAILPLTHIFSQRDWGAVWVYISAGLIVAQAGALSIGVVFAPASWLYRMSAFWAAAVVLFAAWGAGCVAHEWMRQTQFRMDREIYVAVSSMPLLALTIQAPLWGLKLFAGWSLVRPTETANKAPERPLSISDYLVGMAVIAASLAIARLAPHNSTQEFWIGWSIVSASVATVSLIGIPPAMLFVFRWPGGLAGVLLMIAYSTIVALLALQIFWVINASIRVRLGGPNAWELFGLFLILLSFALGLSTALLALRCLGHQLLVSRNSQPTLPAKT
jgi:hypothetical protein